MVLNAPKCVTEHHLLINVLCTTQENLLERKKNGLEKESRDFSHSRNFVSEDSEARIRFKTRRLEDNWRILCKMIRCQ
jgi:hypothetical protein